MIRSAFFSIGMFVVLCGGTFLMVDRVVFNEGYDQPAQVPVLSEYMTANANQQYELAPPEWMPFSLLALGSVTMLYSIALPRKQV